jgi:DNA repair protein RecO (recombination protein O)
VALYRDVGVVLRTHKLGEADRIITVLTKGRGKVRAVAKGVRKTKSRFGARLEPPTHGQFQFYEGRNLDTVTQVEAIDAFAEVRVDLDRLTRAVAMLEAADHLSLEGEPNEQLYTMLVRALRTLMEHDSPLVVAGFFFKLLALEGFRPEVDGCVACGTPDDLVAWAVAEGGLRCRGHRLGRAVSPEAIVLVQRILGGQLGAALNEPPSPAVTEVDHLAVWVLEHHLERRLRSVTALHLG